MPVIFVHGVNNRSDDPVYKARCLAIDGFLRRSLEGVRIDARPLAHINPQFPYWGDLASKFAWNMKSMPSGDREALGSRVEPNVRVSVAFLTDALVKFGDAQAAPIVALAMQSFPRAVDLLTELVLDNTPAEQGTEAARFAVAAQFYAADFEASGTSPAWLAKVTTDAQLCDFLLKDVRNLAEANADAQALGGIATTIGNILALAASKLRQTTQSVASKVLDATGDFASTKILAWTRAPLNATLGRFFGDAFFYFDGRGEADSPGPIAQRILSAWDVAITAAPDEPLVIIGHSLGGVISYDLLTYFRPDITVDLFVSVGSQISHFEELKLFKASKQKYSAASGKNVPTVNNIKHWINVYDEVDIFSYSCRGIFEAVDDYSYDTKTYVIKAHGAYLTQARFYERLRARIDVLPVL